MVLALFLGFFRHQLVTEYNNEIISVVGGVCEHTGESCPFDKINKLLIPTILFSSVLLIMFLLGIYLIFFEKTEEHWKETREELSNKIRAINRKEIEDKTREAFLSGLDENERKVVLAIKEQDGIEQRTLRYRVDFSKALLSTVIKNLVKKDIVNKVPYKRTNKIYLKKEV